MKTIPAIFEGGGFRPLEKVDLPEQARVEEAIVEPATKEAADDNLRSLYEIMSRRFRSGRHDLAARHNEHQP